MKLLQRWLHRRRIEAEMREEMEFHRDARIADLISRGLSPQEAARTARLEFGSTDNYQEACRSSLGYRPLDELSSDLRFAFRGLRNHPGYSAAAIGILALAIGANTAFFTLYSHYALRPLPIRGVERHYDLSAINSQGRESSGWTSAEASALREAGRAHFEGLYTNGTYQVLLLAPTQRHALVTAVSSNYFPLLGGRAMTGRVFSESEEREPFAVLSDYGRKRLFPEHASPIGQKVRVRATVFTVIGVMAPEFTGTQPSTPDFWVSSHMRAGLSLSDPERQPSYDLAGLLAPGATPESAESALSAAASRFDRILDDRVVRVQVSPHTSYIPESEDFDNAAAVVFAAFVLVLLIACANLANLSLARAAARSHEIAMRVALGASRARLVRQLLTESTFLALLGSIGGLAVSFLTVERIEGELVSFLGGLGISMLPVTVDWRVFLFSVLIAILAGIAVGLLPALEVTTPAITVSTKREHSSFAGRIRPRRMRNALIAGQAAASLVLLLLASILARSSQSLFTLSPGYDVNRIYDLKLDNASPSLFAELVQHHNVASFTALMDVPLHGGEARLDASVQGRALRLPFNIVGPDYFDTFELTLDGRAFTTQETVTNARVAIISRSFARDFFHGASPIGRTLQVQHSEYGDAVPPGTYQVIGVAPDVINDFLFRGRPPQYAYFPGAAGQTQVRNAVVRLRTASAAAVEALRKLCSTGADANGCEPAPLRESVAMQHFPFQIAAAVSGGLGLLALLLTALGLYSVTSYTVVQRRREIGIHMALGASSSQMLRRLLREAVRCIAIGLIGGFPVCLLLSHLAQSKLFAIDTFDPVAYAVVPLLLIAIGALACLIPARRAALVDPMRSLREE